MVMSMSLDYATMSAIRQKIDLVHRLLFEARMVGQHDVQRVCCIQQPLFQEEFILSWHIATIVNRCNYAKSNSIRNRKWGL